ncbi:PRC-barrel domain containing protein [Specibacter cremeus]|uniref:PRC-barrel domain containing protein n=1 Tax=Specibacter cremeus TaxID=1629051 RepID=UPI000F7B5A84|nr:PRC-barrel domain containing protein [Specibacter cremeus]
MISLEAIDSIVVGGGIVRTVDGSRLGSVEQVFLAEDSGEPAFVTVRTGLFGLSETFVPLAGATLDGSVISVPYSRSLVRNGPRIESSRGAISADEERALYGYYGLSVATEAEASTDDDAAPAAGAPSGPGGLPHPGGPPPPHPHPGAPPPPHLLRHPLPGPPPPR